MFDSFIIDALLFTVAVLLPGVALLLAAGVRERLMLVAGGATLGLFGVPLLTYVVAILLRTHVSAGLVLWVGGSIVVASSYTVWRRRRAGWEAA